MCGILGLINPNGVDDHRFSRALAVLSHRGPDSSRVENLGNVVLGLARLSIQDLSPAGDQPMADPSRSTWIVFNGEIYNFKELRQELEHLGCRFTSRSDTEVIIQAYLTWGWPDALLRLEGMYGFAIYDQKNQRVLLARDRTGMKPLFYATHGSGLIFASEIKGITTYLGPRMLDPHNSLNPILMTGLSPPGTTMFQGIQELEPGCFLEYDLNSGRSHTQRYFHIADLISPDTYQELSQMRSGALISKYREAVSESVSCHLISDAKIGVMFSGGVDSSLISAAACQTAGAEVALFHFISDLDDDTKYVDSFTKQFSVDLTDLKFNEHEIIFDMPRLIYNYETINKEEGAVLSKVCSAARQKGYKTLLTGDAADELFGGYVPHKSFYTRTVMNNSRVIRFVLRLLRKAFPGVEHAGDIPKGTDYLMFPSGLNLLEVPLNVLLHRGSRLAGWTKCLEAYDFLENPTERESAAFLLDDISYRLQRYLIRADRMGMMESVELRIPFLHLPILRLAVNTPVKWRIGLTPFGRRPDAFSPFNEKRIVKEVAKAFSVPKNIVYRKKVGTVFDGRHQVKGLVEKFPLKNVSEFFEIPEERLREVLMGSFDPDIARIQWGILATEVLMREFIQLEDPADISDEFRSILSF